MSTSYEPTQRFFRPADVAAIRRNQRGIQTQRLIAIASKALLVAGVIAGAIAVYRHTQSDGRFAVKTIEIVGAVHTPRAAISAITRSYIGANLFSIDIARVQSDFGALGWVRRIEAEKKLPDTLRIRIVERTPVALVATDGGIKYVDDLGATFADLSPSVGDSDLPLITGATGAELRRCVTLVSDLRGRDPQVFSRLSEVRPVSPDGFALFDRELGAFVYANGDELSSRWRELYAIVQAEKLGRSAIEYADLRFTDRIVIKPLHASLLGPVVPKPQTRTNVEITN